MSLSYSWVPGRQTTIGEDGTLNINSYRPESVIGYFNSGTLHESCRKPSCKRRDKMYLNLLHYASLVAVRLHYHFVSEVS